MVSRRLQLMIIEIVATRVALCIGPGLPPLLKELKSNLRSKRCT